MDKQIQLKELRKFQEKYPLSHVGGSFGLLLHGIDLKRDISKSDLDVTNPDRMPEIITDNYEESSEPSDFDHRIVIASENNYYVKMEIRVSPEPSFEVIEYEGNKYNVSLLKNIIFWKQKYASKGVEKHYNDLVAMGVNPYIDKSDLVKINNDKLNNSLDMLPFQPLARL